MPILSPNWPAPGFCLGMCLVGRRQLETSGDIWRERTNLGCEAPKSLPRAVGGISGMIDNGHDDDAAGDLNWG
ncbi:hypothetical protein I7I50_05039 [Histoplasma capsulatum G186AR]|uniref:Uncharacterized protein n=1 Tax=Ajellomyces capsulatus TaxID=5037 RepID=A0A8H7Z640_AJECA|nr:hypothetical protein I7I52_03297 [Histoplasma capsulatum]QSS75783.1 hypothetical protein I7I50_05039 [Histoplasma capsulatum G186AR]